MKTKRMRFERWRLAIQLGFTALSNGYLMGFAKGGLYQGNGKYACLPGLNCYACPGALGSCPIGALQTALKDRRYVFSYYAVGFLLLFGALFGRLICGFLCPFGLFQDLLHKIPVPGKIRTFRLDKPLRYLKYGVLVLFVLVLPNAVTNLVGQGDAWFCKYICPSGTLMGGIPQASLNPAIRGAIGFLFGWKMALLLGIVVLSMFLYRPFCKYLCPLGAIYALTNRLSLYRYAVDQEKCVDCGACERACGMGVDIRKTPDHLECIRCGACKAACPTDAIRSGIIHKKA